MSDETSTETTPEPADDDDLDVAPWDREPGTDATLMPRTALARAAEDLRDRGDQATDAADCGPTVRKVLGDALVDDMAAEGAALTRLGNALERAAQRHGPAVVLVLSPEEHADVLDALGRAAAVEDAWVRQADVLTTEQRTEYAATADRLRALLARLATS